MKQPVRLERLRTVEDIVLTPQLIGDILEVLRQILHFEREEGLTASFRCEIPQHLIAIPFDPRNIGRDRIDHHIGLLRHFQRLIAGDAALIVIAIGHNDDGAPEFVPRLVLRQPVAAGEINGVVERRPAARPQVANRFRQLLRIVDQIGNHLGRSVVSYRADKRRLRDERNGGKRALQFAGDLGSEGAARGFQLISIGTRNAARLEEAFHQLRHNVFAVGRAAAVPTNEEFVPRFERGDEHALRGDKVGFAFAQSRILFEKSCEMIDHSSAKKIHANTLTSRRQQPCLAFCRRASARASAHTA